MKTFFLRIFTWWNGQTLNTQLWTSLYGELVGVDEAGNRYYRTKGGKIDPVLGFERRWVIYNGYAEASTIPPSWHGWIHHTVDTPPTEEKYKPRPWQKPHRPNLTGTPGAYRPSGSTLAQGRRPKATGDYKAWTRVAEDLFHPSGQARSAWTRNPCQRRSRYVCIPGSRVFDARPGQSHGYIEPCRPSLRTSVPHFSRSPVK